MVGSDATQEPRVDDARKIFPHNNLTDFGLALHRESDLTADEEASNPDHDGFDRGTALKHLFHWKLSKLGYTSVHSVWSCCLLPPLTQTHQH